MSASIRDQAVACRAASRQVAQLDGDSKRCAIGAMADGLLAAQSAILAANALDLRAAQQKGVAAAMLDRLMLDADRVQAMADGLRVIANLPDPVGIVSRREVRPNGLEVERVRVPLGVIAMIYEARPNVTADAAALCLMAGNAVILRGGSEATLSNQAIAGVLHAALSECGLPQAAVTVLSDTSREAMIELLQLSDIIDLAIPRGGEGLIRFVAEHARVPVIKHYKGVCHLYVDADADVDLALRLLLDGKTTRPAVCNALETLLVHESIATTFLQKAAAQLAAHKVELRACARSLPLLAGSVVATESDYAAEFLDLVLAVRVVDDLDAAVAHIVQYGSDHTEVIATRDAAAAQRFVRALRSAVVMVNASSRFSDGGQLGLGAEIGISTTRLHAYGPMGAESLTIERYVVRGDGQVRHPASSQ